MLATLAQRRRLPEVFKIIQGSKHENEDGRWQRQASHSSERLLPIRCGEENQSQRYERHD